MEYRPIPDFDARYAAGSDGFIYRRAGGQRPGRPLRWRKLKGNADGTACLVRGDGAKVMTSVAKQILRAWVGPQPLGFEPLRYPDQDPTNNRPDNLRWAPRGTSKIGDPRLSEASRRRKHVAGRAFEDSQVAAILGMHVAGVAAVEIAERWEVCRRVIDQILGGHTYRHVPRPPGMRVGRRDPRGTGHPKAILAPGKMRKIRRLKATGLSGRKIAAQLGLKYGVVRRVLDGSAWQEIT